MGSQNQKRNDARERSEKLLREYLDEVLNEEGLLSGFLSPFSDVLKTAAWGAEKLGNSARNAITSTFKEIPSVLIPGLKYDWEQVKKNEKELMKGIDAKYQDVLTKNTEALKNSDLSLFMFALDPASTIAHKLSPKVPAVALSLAEPLVSAVSPKAGATVGRWKDWAHKAGQNVSLGGGTAAKVSGGDWDPAMSGGEWGGLGEQAQPQAQPQAQQQAQQQPQGQQRGQQQSQQQSQQQQKPKPPPDVSKILKNKQILNALENSPLTKQMRQNALNSIIQRVQKVMKADSFDQMNQIVGAEMTSKIRNLVEKQKGQVSDEEFKKLEQSAIVQAQQVVKNFYVKQLQDVANQLPNAKNDILNVVSKLKQMK